MKKGLFLFILGISSALFSQERYLNEHSGMIEHLNYLNENIIELNERIKEIQTHNFQRDEMILKILTNLNEVANEYKTQSFTN